MIVAVDTGDLKLELARTFGATHTFNVSGEENGRQGVVQAHRRRRGLCLRLRGTGQDRRTGLGVLRRGGTAVIVGIANAADRITLNAQQVALSEKTLTGCYYGIGAAEPRFSSLARACPRRPAEARRLITRTYSIEEARRLSPTESGREGRGVIIFDPAEIPCPRTLDWPRKRVPWPFDRGPVASGRTRGTNT